MLKRSAIFAVLIILFWLNNNLLSSAEGKLPHPKEMLRNNEVARYKVSYLGTSVITNTSFEGIKATSVIKIAHSLKGIDRIEYISSTERKAGDIIISSEELQLNYDASSGEWFAFYKPSTWAKARRKYIEELLERTFSQSLLEYKGTESIAGRRAYVLYLAEKRTGRVYTKIWLDSEHWITLRIESYGENEELESFSTFSDIYFFPSYIVIDEREWIPESPEAIAYLGQRPIALDKAEEELPHPIFLPTYLPLGFAVEKHLIAEREDKLEFTTHFTNKTGFIILTEKEEPYNLANLSSYEDVDIGSYKGKLWSNSEEFTRRLIWNFDIDDKKLGFSLTASRDVSEEELFNIAASISDLELPEDITP